ncbi:Hypothetical protein D9617_11g009200 [Elsinoe fawcettii]|nr:Hypothetical protein D9617_11g009200 [Elsinoe fawcettii]
MAVIHIVLFEFKPSVSPQEVTDVSVCDPKDDNCKHPKTGLPYVRSHGGGRDNSPEGLQGGFTHGFVYEFDNEEDRDYYVKDDPAHLDFVASIKDVVQGARVVDFTPDVL